MRSTRFITAIIAFVGTFAISVGLVGLLFGFPAKPAFFYSRHKCNDRQANAIYAHISRDVNNGRERDYRSFRTNNWEKDGDVGYSIENHANSVAQYVDESSSMNVSHLPQDFQIAWQKHMDAWHDYSEFLNERKNSSDIDEDDFVRAENPYNAEINRTWYEVLRIGRGYGADVR